MGGGGGGGDDRNVVDTNATGTRPRDGRGRAMMMIWCPYWWEGVCRVDTHLLQPGVCRAATTTNTPRALWALSRNDYSSFSHTLTPYMNHGSLSETAAAAAARADLLPRAWSGESVQ